MEPRGLRRIPRISLFCLIFRLSKDVQGSVVFSELVSPQVFVLDTNMEMATKLVYIPPVSDNKLQESKRRRTTYNNKHREDREKTPYIGQAELKVL